MRVRFRSFLFFAVGPMLAGITLSAQNHSDFEARLQTIMHRPEFRHSRFGVEIYSMTDHKVLYAWRPDELCVPGSTTKLLTVGSALELLGPDFRFHTKVYRAGSLSSDGTLNGDLILVASGDPNLSGRLQQDGTLAFEDEDHSYDGFASAKAVAGDPLLVIRELARKIAAKGVHRVNGRVLVDVSMFPEEGHELGTRVMMSPVIVNDNVIDVMVRPGQHEGEAPALSIAPETRYLKIVNEAKSGAAGTKTELEWTKDMAHADGTHTVTFSGSIPAGSKPRLRVYKVPKPSQFAQFVFTEALQEAGVQVSPSTTKIDPDYKELAHSYTSENEVAEHVSLPLSEEAKVTLKVSQNLHASTLPYLVGAYLKKDSTDPLQAGFDLESGMLKKAGLDLTAAVQNDGAGGAAMFSPDFMVHFLLHMADQPFFPAYFKALPILGKDGTLAEIEVESPAAGHVFAKTGTMGGGNALSHGGIIEGKGLAGFIDAKDGRRFAFAAYINFVPLPDMEEATVKNVGEAVGQIASAAYDGFTR